METKFPFEESYQGLKTINNEYLTDASDDISNFEDEDEEQNNTKNRLDESGNTQPKIDENWHQCINNELETPRNSDNLNKQNQPLYHGTRVRF